MMPFTCPYCGKHYASFVALKAHTRASHSKVCPVCGKVVIRMSSHLRLDDPEHRLLAFIFYKKRTTDRMFSDREIIEVIRA